MPSITQNTHKAVLTGLSYGTTYSYRVGAKPSGSSNYVWSDVFTFTTRESNPSDYTFLYLSDTQFGTDNVQGGNELQNVINGATTLIGEDPAFMMHGGDFGDVTSYSFLYGNIIGQARNWFAKHPSFVATGNHDSDSKVLTSRFAMPTDDGGNFSFNYGNAHYVVLNNGPEGKKEFDSNIGTWLSSDLSKSANQKQWTIVMFHRPMFSVQDYEGTVVDDHVAARREKLLPVFDEYGVDLVLQAHTHTYSYTYPITAGSGDGKYTKHTYTSDGIYRVNPNGTIFMNTPCCGGVPDKDETPAGYDDSYLEAKFAPDNKTLKYSFTTVQVGSDKLTVKTYYRENPITNSASNTLAGEFGIKKS